RARRPRRGPGPPALPRPEILDHRHPPEGRLRRGLRPGPRDPGRGRGPAVSRIGILLSGRGSNFLAIHAAIERGEVPAEIAVVVANIADAPGLAKARELGLRAEAIPHRGEPGRRAHEEKVMAVLRAAEVDWVCLAGYMRRL